MAGDSPEKKEGDEEDEKKEGDEEDEKKEEYRILIKVFYGIIRLTIYSTWHSVSGSCQHPPSCY